MSANSRTDVLLSPWFLLGLATLLLNDFLLKNEYSNELTGKLSDVSGLFIFPFFFSALFPKYTRAIYLFTIVIFGYWNSSLSQGLIEVFNRLEVPVGRTIDSTDFFALAILPVSYFRFEKQISKPRQGLMNSIRIIISSIAIFSFMATTLARHTTQLSIKSGKAFVIDMDKKEFFTRLQAADGKSDTLELNLIDSLFYLHYYLPDVRAKIAVLANIRELNSKTIIRVDSILTGTATGRFFSKVGEDDIRKIKDIGQTEHEGYFETYFINELHNQEGQSGRLFFNNKRIYDELLKQY